MPGKLAKVLIIDDDPDSCETVSKYLEKAEHATRCVPNGHEALAALSADLPDAIILDVRMPVMDGIEVLEVLKSYLRWSTVPVALFTAYAEDPRLKRAQEFGVSRVFHKSKTDLSQLLAWVDANATRRPPAADEPPAHDFEV